MSFIFIYSWTHTYSYVCDRSYCPKPYFCSVYTNTRLWPPWRTFYRPHLSCRVCITYTCVYTMCIYLYTMYYIVNRYLRIILLYLFIAYYGYIYCIHQYLPLLYYIGFAQAWRRAGDALGDLRQYTAAIDYYDVAVRLDPTLGETLLSNIGRRKRSQL